MVEIKMQHHLVNDSSYNTINLQSINKLQGMTNIVGLTFSLDDTIPWFRISIEQDDYRC